jgi:hypothetical protein
MLDPLAIDSIVVKDEFGECLCKTNKDEHEKNKERERDSPCYFVNHQPHVGFLRFPVHCFEGKVL